MSARRGFALLAVLWIITGAAILSLAAHAAGRQALHGSRNRLELLRSRWRSHDCLERARDQVAQSLSPSIGNDVAGSSPPATWRELGRIQRVVDTASVGCALRIEAAGTRFDANTISEETLGALAAALGIGQGTADSLADALLDWRDADTIARPIGAERSWYEFRGQLPPRDGPLADARELESLRGYASHPRLMAALGTEPGRLPLGHAPAPLLAALPGFGPEAVARVMELRSRGEAVPDIVALGGLLSPLAREALLARYADLIRLTTTEPDAWILTSVGESGSPPIRYATEVRLVRAGDRAAIVRRRSWLE